MSKTGNRRTEYLHEVLDMAAHVHVECVDVTGYREKHGPGPNYTIHDDSIEDGVTSWPVTLDTIRKGLRLVREATPDGEGGTSIKFLTEGMRREIMLGDRSNGENGNWDDGYLVSAVVEIGLWGQVMYG